MAKTKGENMIKIDDLKYIEFDENDKIKMMISKPLKARDLKNLNRSISNKLEG